MTALRRDKLVNVQTFNKKYIKGRKATAWFSQIVDGFELNTEFSTEVVHAIGAHTRRHVGLDCAVPVTIHVSLML